MVLFIILIEFIWSPSTVSELRVSESMEFIMRLSPSEKRKNARYLKRFGCAVRGIVERIYHPTRDLRETRLPVIRVKEKEVSARMRMRIDRGGKRGRRETE